MVRPKSEYWECEPTTARDIHWEDRDTFTGLLDHNAQPIHRTREPIGFNPNRWEAKPSRRKSR